MNISLKLRRKAQFSFEDTKTIIFLKNYVISLKVQKSPKTYYKSPQKNSRLHTKLKFLLRLSLYTEISNDFSEKT